MLKRLVIALVLSLSMVLGSRATFAGGQMVELCDAVSNLMVVSYFTGYWYLKPCDSYREEVRKSLKTYALPSLVDMAYHTCLQGQRHHDAKLPYMGRMIKDITYKACLEEAAKAFLP